MGLSTMTLTTIPGMDDDASRYTPARFWRLTFRAADTGAGRTVWAKESPVATVRRKFWVYTKKGERRDELVICGPADIISCAPAWMNPASGELETLS